MDKWKPGIGETYFIPYLMFFEADCVTRVWAGAPIEKDWYKSGFVCRTKEEALELAEKMLAVAKERVKNVE